MFYHLTKCICPTSRVEICAQRLSASSFSYLLTFLFHKALHPLKKQPCIFNHDAVTIDRQKCFQSLDVYAYQRSEKCISLKKLTRIEMNILSLGVCGTDMISFILNFNGNFQELKSFCSLLITKCIPLLFLYFKTNCCSLHYLPWQTIRI